MINSLKNICSEFSSSYDVSGNKRGIQIQIEVEIEYLGDLATVFDLYKLELIAIESVTEMSSKCKAIFLQTAKQNCKKD